MHSTAAGAARAVRVAVAGATGYTGQELLRILSRHPHVSIVAATSSGASAARKLPALARIWTGTITPLEPEVLARDADLVFLALPDTAAADLAPRFADAGVRVIDLSGAFRLRDASLRARWYPETHRMPGDLAYGLTELARDAVRRARVVGSALPEIKHVAHTNFCDIGWRVDGSGRVVIVSVIDNLLKGASGQAVQNMNVMIGAPETAGLL